MRGSIKLTFEVTKRNDDEFVSRASYTATLPENSDFDTVREYCIDGIRAMGYTFADGDFL